MPFNADLAKLLLVNQKILLECWPVEEYLLTRGKQSEGRTFSGSLVMLTDKRSLAQLRYLRITSRGHRVLGLQDGTEVSIHDVVDEIWPYDNYGNLHFAAAVASAESHKGFQPLHLKQVAEVVHRVDQARYWGMLKQQLSSAGLSEQGKASLEKQLKDCAKLLQSPPPASMLAMVQAACEDQEAGEEVSEGRVALNAYMASVCRPLSNHNLPHKETLIHLRRQPEQTGLAAAPGAAAIHNNEDGLTGNGHEPTESAQLDTGNSKSILQSILQHISPQHEWRRQLEQVMGLHNAMNAMIACVQESDTVHKQDAHSEQAERAARAFAVKVCQQHACRLKDLAAAALATVFAFARHQVIAGPSLLLELERMPLSEEEYTSALERILQSLRAQQQDEPQSWSPEVLQTCEKAQKAIKHAIGYEHEIAEEMQQHAQTLQESAKRMSAQLEQVKCVKSPEATSAQPVSPSHAAEAKASPAAASGTDAHSSADQNKPPKVKQKPASPNPSIAAKGKRKRIEWDAQVAAATNAQTLRAAALASHAEKVNASKAEAAMSKPPSPASQKRRAIESKPSAALLSNTKPLSPASQKRRAGKRKLSAAPLGDANASQSEGEAAVAKSLSPPTSQKRKSAARKLCAAPVAGANDQSESKATSAQAAGTAAATGPTAAATASHLQRSKPLLLSSAPAAEAAAQQSLRVNEALSDVPQEAADTAVAPTDRPDKLSAQALVEAFPKTPPGTPPDTPQKAKATTTAVQPASKLDSAPQVGNPAEPASMHSIAPETEHGGEDDASVLWQGVVSWSWGPDAAAKGTFASSLAHVMTFPSGCRWRDGELNLELDSHSLQFAELCCFDSAKAQSLADAYTGHLFLLSNGSAAQLQQALKRGFMSVQHQDAEAITESSVNALQGALSHGRLLGCLEANGCALVTRWGKSCQEAGDSSHSQALHLILMACASLHSWLPLTLMNQQEHEEIAALKDSPSTLWALPFLSGPETASALTQMESQPISPKSLSAPSMGMSKQPVPETKLLADESTEVSARASAELHRATAPAGPCTISAKQTPQQKASASQSFHVTAYQPTVTSTDHMLSVSNGAIPGESQMDGQRGAAAQSKDGEVRAGGMSDGIQIKQAAMNSSSALQSAVHDGKPDSQELLADAGGSIQQAKGSAVCADRSDAGEPAQSRKRASQAQTADEQHPSAASSPSDHAPLPAGTASDSLHVSEQPVNGHAGPSKHVAEAAQGSKAAAQHLLQSASKKGGRDEQQVAGPTRSGSPADTSEPPARDKSQAADVQAGGAAKQARARRTIQAASTAMTATEDVLPSKQNKQQQSQTAGEVEQSSAQQPALSGKQASKWQKQPASAQEEPTLRKRQKVSEAVPQNKSAGGSKAADAGQTKSQRSSKDAPADERQPDVRCDLPSQTMHNIYDSLKQLGLLQNQWRKGELTRQHIYELDCHAPLVQLHTLAQYGSKFEPRGDPVKFLDICTNNMVKLHANTTWLAHRLYNLGFQYKLSPDALSLQQRLVALRMLPKDAVPELAAQVLPVELQPAYVLALGGYQGNRLPRFAQTLLHSILWQVCWTLHQCPSSSQNFKVALNKYELATGRPFKLATDPAGKAKDPQKPNRSSAGTDTATALATAGTTGASAAQTAKHGNTGKRKHSPIPIPGSAAATAAAASLAEQTQTAVSHRSPDGRSSSVTDKPTQHCSQADSVKLKKPKKSVQLSIGQVADTAFKGLVKLGKMQADSLDELSLDFLRKQSHLWQLRILSLFSQRVRMGRASAFLTSLCKANRIEAGQGDLRWAQPAEQIENYALGLLHLACRAGLVSKDLGSTDVFKAIPADLHSVAVCYAIGSCSGASGVTAQQHSSTSHALQKATGQASSALHTFVQYTQQLMEREGLNCPPFAPPQATRPTRPHTAPPASAQYPSYPSLQAQNSFPSFDRPSSLHQTSRPHQQQAHNNLEDYDKPCPDYYRATGSCDKQDCPYLHGSHDEYVAYVQRLGLIPYGLKFHSQVGRDRWVADAAVDVLNDMMKRNIISRGSFSGRDLQPLAFLDDPVNGNHAQLQLQVVRRLSQLQNVKQPAKALEELILQTSNVQAGYGSRASGPAPAAASIPSSSHPMDRQHAHPADAPDFTPYDPFAPDTGGFPYSNPHSEPPSHNPPPGDFTPADYAPGSEEEVEDPLPFPCFRYEEELAVALLQNGAVHSVEHLLAVAPGCSMPLEVLDSFQGRFPGDIEQFLLNRPGLFVVGPDIIDVTDHARVSLVYKREVLQALWQALHDNVQLSLGDLAEIGPKFERINDIIADHGGLAKFLSTPLFCEDINVFCCGPGDIRVLLRPHLANLMAPNFQYN